MPKPAFTLLIGFLLLILSACSGESASQTAVPTMTEFEQDEDISTPSTQDTELTIIQLPMGYIPDPQYAPFYVADDKGYFANEGLAIEYDYGFETDGVALVGAGQLPFAVVSGEQVILARAQDLPVVYIFEWFQRFPIALISKSSSGIEAPGDLSGRKVGLPGFFGASYVGFAALLKANGLIEEEVETSDIGFTQVESLLTDQVEAVVGYVNNEPLQLENLGQDLNVIMVADSADLVANGIIANEEIIAENPNLALGFIRALSKGLADTLANPDEAFQISKKYVEALDDSRRNVLDASLELWRSEPLGISELSSWENTQQTLMDIGFLDSPIADLQSIYTNEFSLAAQP